jgi:hypothetical protein
MEAPQPGTECPFSSGREVPFRRLSLDFRFSPVEPTRFRYPAPTVSHEEHEEGLRERLSRQGEETLGRLAEDLIGNPLVNAALSRAFEAREKAVQAQEAAMGALGIPSAADVERMTRRLRSVSQRLEGIEDGLDRLEVRLDTLSTDDRGGQDLGGIEARLDEIARDLASLRAAVAPGGEPPPRAQERLTVGESS